MPLTERGIDFVVYDNRGQIVLLGEAKSRRGTSEKWAARFRRNMLEHGTLPSSPFFFIATPEHLYFWRQDNSRPVDEPPEFTMDAERELKPYFEKARQTPAAISEQGLENLVLSWLTDIARYGQSRAKDDPSLRWLVDSGLMGALEEARIEINAA